MKTIQKLIMLALILTLTLNTFHAEEIIYPTTIGGMTVNVKLTGNGSITGLKQNEDVRFQTLTFQETEYQKINNKKEELYINGKTIYPKYILDEYGNKQVSFTIKENGEFTYTLEAEITTDTIIFETTDYIINETQNDAKQFLEPSEKVENDSIEIKTIEKNKLAGKTFLETLNTTILWVNDYVEYPQNDTSEFYKYYISQNSAIETLLSKKGVCDEFANLAAAILRAKGVPTKLAIGITFDGKEWGNHAWIETYHNKHGWIPSDPTFREPGFTDATHIKTGSFTDVTQSLAKAVYPSTASVTFDTQSKLPEVKILNKRYFNNVELSSENENLKTKQWNEIKIKIKNTTNGTILAPIKIKGKTSNELNEIACLQNTEPKECLIVDEAKKSILLQPKEEKIITFKLYPNINVEKEYKIDTNLTIYSLSEPYTKPIEIIYAEPQNNGEIIIKDITPITSEEKTILQIRAINLFPEEKTITLKLKTNEKEKITKETINGFEVKQLKKELEDTNTTLYTLTIETPTSIYTQAITLTKEEKIIPEIPEIKQTSIEQKIESKKTEPTLIEKIVKTPLLIFGGLLAIVGTLLFAIFLVNKKYI